MLPAGRFIEVFVNAPVEVCEKRDVKGLYAKARAGQLKEFTGVSAPYEAPGNPEINLHTDEGTPEMAVAQIIRYLNSIANEDAAASKGEQLAPRSS